MEYENKNLTYERDQLPGTDIPFDLDGSITAEQTSEKHRSYASRRIGPLRSSIIFSLKLLGYTGRKTSSKKDSNVRTDRVSGDWSGLQGLI